MLVHTVVTPSWSGTRVSWHAPDTVRLLAELTRQSLVAGGASREQIRRMATARVDGDRLVAIRTR